MGGEAIPWKVAAAEATLLDDEEKRAKAARYAAQEAVALKRILEAYGIPGEPTGPEVEVDGITFRVDFMHGLDVLSMAGACPNCGVRAFASLHSFSDVGRQLREFKPTDHVCETPESRLAAALARTPAERLIGALRDFIVQEAASIAGELDRGY